MSWSCAGTKTNKNMNIRTHRQDTHADKGTFLQSYISTHLHLYKSRFLESYTSTKLHFHRATFLQSYIFTRLQCNISTHLHVYNATCLESYTSTNAAFHKGLFPQIYICHIATFWSMIKYLSSYRCSPVDTFLVRCIEEQILGCLFEWRCTKHGCWATLLKPIAAAPSPNRLGLVKVVKIVKSIVTIENHWDFAMSLLFVPLLPDLSQTDTANASAVREPQR